MPGQPLYPVQGSASPPPTPVQEPPAPDHDGPSTDLIVVLSIAGLIVVALLVSFVISALKKRRRRRAALAQQAPHVASTQQGPQTPQQSVNRTDVASTQGAADSSSQLPPRTTSGEVILEVPSGAVDSVQALGTSATGGNQTEGDPNKGKAISTESPPRQYVPVEISPSDRDPNKGKAINTESPPRQDVSAEIIPTESIPTREPPQPVFPSSGYKSCYKDCFHPKCDVCKNFIPADKDGLIEYQEHPFWMQTYCPSHEDDGTPRCCSCERLEVSERMEATGIKYITLDDGRELCWECYTSAIMNSPDCQHLYMDIQEFFEGLNMKVEKQVILFLVQRQALKEAMEAEKSGHHPPETRGLCLFEEHIVRAILTRPTTGPGNRIMDVTTEPYKLVQGCEVIAILILYGLPWLHTGCILAHEMMHAYLHLKGYRSLTPQVEEGICQVLSHMWLESKIIAGVSGNTASMLAAAASSSSSLTPTSKKKGAKTEFEKKLAAFIKNQMETDTSLEFGEGFRAGIRALEKHGLRGTLDHMKITGSFPC